MRLFVAVDLSSDALDAIAVEQRRLASSLAESRGALKLVAREQLHLTLLFLGNVDERQAAPLVDAINAPADVEPFDVIFGGVGMFPDRSAPRVLWIGVTAGASKLSALHALIAGRVRTLAIDFDDRLFRPHLTIGRWRESRPSDRRRIAGAPASDVARVHVDRATLYQSHLSSSGPKYTPLARVTLRHAARTGPEDGSSAGRGL